MSAKTNIVSESIKTTEKKKEISYGLDKPLTVKWGGNSTVGEYITVSASLSVLRSPLELVLSKHIGKSKSIPEKSWVVNHRKDVPELIAGAGDPMKKRHQEIIHELKMKEAEAKGLLEDVGGKYLITKKLNEGLIGQNVEHYLDRSNKLFIENRDVEKAKHDEIEKAKPFRVRKKFVNKKSVLDFMTKEEKATQIALNNVWNEPAFVLKVEESTRSDYETLIDGIRPQVLLELKNDQWKDYSNVHILNEVGKDIFQFLSGKYNPLNKDQEVQKLKATIQEQAKKIDAHEHEKKVIHNYYQNSDLYRLEVETRIRDLNSRIDELEQENTELKEQIKVQEEDELEIHQAVGTL